MGNGARLRRPSHLYIGPSDHLLTQGASGQALSQIRKKRPGLKVPGRTTAERYELRYRVRRRSARDAYDAALLQG